MDDFTKYFKLEIFDVVALRSIIRNLLRNYIDGVKPYVLNESDFDILFNIYRQLDYGFECKNKKSSRQYLSKEKRK